MGSEPSPVDGVRVRAELNRGTASWCLRSTWCGKCHLCQSVECERGVETEFFCVPRRLPALSCSWWGASAVWPGGCPSIHLPPEVTVTEGAAHVTRMLDRQEGLFCSARMVLASVWEPQVTHSAMPHALQDPWEPASLPMLVQSWQSGQGVRRPGAWSFRAASLSLPGAAQVFAGSSCGLPETRQDTLWVLGAVLSGGPCPVPLFPGHWVRLKWPRRLSQTWDFLALRAFLEGPSPGEHRGGVS